MMRACMHPFPHPGPIPAYLPAHMHTCIHVYIPAHLHTYLLYIVGYMNSCIITRMHSRIDAFMHSCILSCIDTFDGLQRKFGYGFVWQHLSPRISWWVTIFLMISAFLSYDIIIYHTGCTTERSPYARIKCSSPIGKSWSISTHHSGTLIDSFSNWLVYPW